MVPDKEGSPPFTGGATPDTDKVIGPTANETQAFEFPPLEETMALPVHDSSATRTFATADDSGYSGRGTRRAAAVLHTGIGDYEVLHELGRGGMGVVYLARHKQLQRDVALKMVLAGAYAGEEQLSRFLTEAKSVAKLQHSNIVQLFDIGEQDGLPYFSLEFVDGQSLAENIRKHAMSPLDAALLVERLARAMQYAHDHGILHRDLKPANVLLMKDGTPKISDFGLAKRLEGEDDSGTTRTGTIMGTPSYMSPEQARGLTHEIGPASDEYSLGAILYELLTGRPPFRAAQPVETVLQVIHNEPVAPRQLQPKLPVDLETICLKALHKDPAKRYGTCALLADDLRRFQAGEPILARPVSGLQRAWRWCRRNPRVAIPSAVALIGVLAALVVSTVAYFKVSGQNVTILKERDKANDATIKANREAANAKRQEGIAKERAAAATAQANLVITNMQTILDNVVLQLAELPQLIPARLRVLETIVDAWDKIDTSVRDDVEGTAIPTLMVARQKIADVYISLGQFDLADAEYQKLYDIAKHRVTVKQGTDGSRFNLAMTCLQLSGLRQQIQRNMQLSREYLEESLQLLQDIRKNPKPDPVHGTVPRYIVTGMIAEAVQNLGVLHLRDGQLQQAKNYFEEAFREREQILKSLAGDPAFAAMPELRRKSTEAELRLSLDKSYLALAEVSFRSGDSAEAEKLNRMAVERRKQVFEADTQSQKNKLEFARVTGHTGEFFLLSGRTKEARKYLENAIRLLKEIVADDPKTSTNRESLCFSLYRLGCTLDVLGHSAEAIKTFDECRQYREELLNESKDSQKRQSLLMLASARCGDIDKVMKWAESLRETARPDAELLLERARALAQCSVVGATDEQRTALVDAAFEALQAAIDAGYRDPFKLQIEPDLKPLHSDPRFLKVLAHAAPENPTAATPPIPPTATP